MNKTLKLLAIAGIAVAVNSPADSLAEDAASILEAAAEKDTERKKDVSGYVVHQTLMGHRNSVYYERRTVESATGEPYDIFRAIPRDVPDSAMYESYKQALHMGGVMDPEKEAQMAEAQAQLAEFEKQLASLPANGR